GDDVLRHVSDRLKGQLRESDTVARLGGDEFAIILPGVVDEAAAGATAGRILQALQEPLMIEDEPLEVRASVGIALFPRHAENALTLHYQPVLRCGSGDVVGVEALVRWPHPRHGMLPPIRFIPLAEQSRLIRPLGRRVLEAAVQQQDRWWREGITLRMAVNLS